MTFFLTTHSFAQQLAIEIPVCEAMDAEAEGQEDHEIHSYSGFTLCYRESYELSEWVAYILTKNELNKVTGRPKKSYTDFNISTISADSSDYT